MSKEGNRQMDKYGNKQISKGASMKKSFFLIAVVLVLVASAGCASSQSPSGGTLTGQVWALTDLAGKAPLKDTGISIQFNSDGTVATSTTAPIPHRAAVSRSSSAPAP
jgi:hypothetical protein